MAAREFDWSGVPRAIEREAVDADAFAAEVQPLDRPVVMRGLAEDWPAVRAGRESPRAFCEFLCGFDAGQPVSAFYGAPDIAGRFFYRDDLRGFNFERREYSLAGFLDLLLQHLDDDRPPAIYTGALRVPVNLPGLREHHYHGLFEPSVEQLVSLWMGNRTRTAAHHDLAQNIACVLRGRRRFIMLPVTQLPNLYMGPIDHTPAGQSISLVDFLAPDFERHPRFRDAVEQAQVADLEPGDALYLPSMWFHHVETLAPLGAMLNFWWRDGPAHMFTPFLTLLHALLSIRDMPEREREAWRTMFDHYIFRAGDDPVAHLPPEARGVLGEMTPERVAHLRRTLGRSLLGK